MVPALIMMVPAFMVPDNRVSPYVQGPAVNARADYDTKEDMCDSASSGCWLAKNRLSTH